MRRAVEDRAEVVVERRRHAAGAVARMVRMHLVGAVERGRVVGDRRQHLDIELDELQGIFGQGATLGDHHRVRVADIADLVVGEHLERPGRAAAEGGCRPHRSREETVEVGGGEHGHDAAAPRARRRSRSTRCGHVRRHCAERDVQHAPERRRRRRIGPGP